MKTTKFVAAVVVIFALLLGGCSPSASNSAGGSTTTTPQIGGTTLASTTEPGGTSTTPGSAGTADTLTTPGANTTQDTTTTPETNTNTTGTSEVAGTLDPNGTPTGMASTDTSGTTTPMTSTDTSGTTTPMTSTDTSGTTTPMATTDASGTTTPMATTDASGTTTPMATTDTTKTPESNSTPSSTATVDAMATAVPTSEGVVAAAGGTAGDLLTLQSSFEQIYNKVNPSVVYIEVVMDSASSTNSTSTGPARASGSGFVWDAQGHIVTNNHVVSGAKSVNVTFMDGTTVTAKVVGQDPNADLAVLQVTVAANELHPVTMGDSTKVRVGQIAIAIGNPFGLAGSMSQGVISALARSLPVESSNQNQSQTNPTTGVYNIPNIIQTDAAINPGNSGGVLVNLQGEVIGVTAAIASQSQSNSGIGFVIPSEIVMKVVPDLISTGKYAHPWLGVTGVTVSPDVASKINMPATQRGILIVAVTPTGPAAAAGLQPSTIDSSTGNVTTVGDVITSINGQPVRVFEDMGSYLFLHTKPGDVVTLTVQRAGKEQTVKVTLGTLPTP